MRSGDGDHRDAEFDTTACASSSVDSPPASAKRRHDGEADAEAPRQKKLKSNDVAEATSTPSSMPGNPKPQPSPSATTSGGPASAELHGTKLQLGTDADSSELQQWGTLISQNPQHPDIILKQHLLLFGRTPGADVNFKDGRIPFEACSIKVSRHGRLCKSSLHCLSAMRLLSHNGRKLQKNERVELQGGDELSLSGEELYSFVFQPLEAKETVAPAVELGNDSIGAKGPCAAAPVKHPRLGGAFRNVVQSMLPSSTSILASESGRRAGLSRTRSDEQPQPREGCGEGQDSDHERVGPVVTLPTTSDIQPAEQAETASGLAVGLANVCMERSPLDELLRDLERSSGEIRKQQHQPQYRRASQERITIVPSTVNSNATSGRDAQPISSASGRPPRKAGTIVDRVVRDGKLGLSITTPVQDIASIVDQSTDHDQSKPSLMPPVHRRVWAEWMQKQAATAQAAAAQATAVAASAAAAVVESAPPQAPASALPSIMLQKLVSDLESSVERQPGADDAAVSWNNFPHYMSEGTRAALHNTAFLHLQRPAFTRLVAGVSGLSNRIWLSGPSGSELYQEQLVRALAKAQDAQLLVFDLAALVPPPQLQQPPRRNRYLERLADATTAAGGRSPLHLLPEEDEEQSTCDDEEATDDWAVELKGSGATGWTTPQFAAISRCAANSSRGGASAGHFRRQSHSRADLASMSQQFPFDTMRSKLEQDLGDVVQSMTAQPPTADGAVGNIPKGGFRRGDRVRVVLAFGTSQGLAAGGTRGHPGTGGYSQAAERPNHSSRQSSRPDCAATVPGGGTGAGRHRGPLPGAVGTVLLTFPDNPERVGIGFDVAVSGGITLNGACPPGYGFFCSVQQLTVIRSESASPDRNAILAAADALFNFVNDVSRSAPLVVFLKDASKVVPSQLAARLYASLVTRIRSIEGNRVVIIASHCEPPEVRKGSSSGSGLAAILGGPSMLGGLDHLLEGLPRRGRACGTASSAASMRVTKMLGRVMTNHVTLAPPPAEPALSQWNRMLQSDSATLRCRANSVTLTKACAKLGLQCYGIHEVAPSESTLSSAHAERVVGWALTSLLTDASVLLPPQAAGPRLDLPQSCLKAALATHASIIAEGEASGKRFKDLKLDNEFERKLLEEVIPPDEVGTTFDDIGALDAVKDSLREVVMLPLQRPELFKRGALMKPTKGVLLFGPPGTGKTMLAKAVAAESGANFLNISMSALASKWFGEGEKYVKALFSLAHRLAPAVIFVDEVDSMLSRREKSGEHEAMRKIKNEFMSNWDGLRTNNADRVLVLAATNRPADLDEAVIRRLPRRLLVDLPNAVNRGRILKVILKEEQLEDGFNVEQIAGMTTGYSGSDLKALCIAAAHRPIRDLLAREAGAAADLEESQSLAGTNAISVPAGESLPAAKATRSAADGGGDLVSGAAAATANATAIGGSNRIVTDGDAAPRNPSGEAAALIAAAPTALPSAVCTILTFEDLRPLSMVDMKEAMKQVGASNSSDAVTMSELRQWNDMYGEGGSRRSEQPTYFM